MCRSCRMAVSRMLRHTIFGTMALSYAVCWAREGPPGRVPGALHGHDLQVIPGVTTSLELDLDLELVAALAGLGNGHRGAGTGNLRGPPRVVGRPVAVRVAVVEGRDRGLRRDLGGDTVAVEGHRVGLLLAERGVERLATVTHHRAGAVRVVQHDRRRAGVDREDLAATGVDGRVVVEVLTVGEPDEHAVLVREALHPVRLAVAPAEVVRAGLERRVVAAVGA